MRWRAVRWRDDLVERLHRLYPRHGALVSALVLARREGLDPEVRDAFAVTGIAHLLAISGFHVGLIAGLLFAAVRAAGRSRRTAALIAAGGAWVYVALIGFPDAAFRAALILSFVAVSRARGYPPSRWGPLASAGLVLLVLEPSRLAGPGFQLSFAGAAGLLAWAGPVERTISAWARQGLERWRPGLQCPRALTSALAAGIAATAATLPVVAWHFERVSLVGVPLTLAATPLVGLALPAALLTLGLDFASRGLAAFVAGGVGVLLDVLVAVTSAVASWPWASAWTTRTTVVAGCLGVAAAAAAARAPGVRRITRLRLTALYGLALVVGWPAVLSLGARGRLEIVMIDVGQGDAIAIRTPRDRWVLVDAGPPGHGDPGAHPVVRALSARGVGSLERLVLTHPDLDHIGGAGAVLDRLDPRAIVDPMLVAPKTGYAELVESAALRGIPWSAARAGDVLDLDGVSIRVLYPDTLPADAGEGNAASVVLLVRWNDFEALLTGDAYVDVEREIAPTVGDIDVLKVGHHGSRTSTDSTFLARVRPEIALLSVGRDNRYGHPAPEVVARLEAAGASIYRTDRQGTVRVLVGRDGSVRVRSDR
jgi:competence protein ComEC